LGTAAASEVRTMAVSRSHVVRIRILDSGYGDSGQCQERLKQPRRGRIALDLGLVSEPV
jgi:hypothetical protein